MSYLANPGLRARPVRRIRCGRQGVRWRGVLGVLLAWLGLLGGAVAQVRRPPVAPPAAAALAPLPDSLLANIAQSNVERLETAYSTLSSLSTDARGVYSSRDVAEGLPELNDNLHAIRHSVEETGRVVDIKQVQMCKLMLANIQEQFTDWRTGLAGARRQLEGMQRRLGQLVPVPAPAKADTVAAHTLAEADTTLENRRQQVARLLARKLRTVARLQTQVATSYIQSLELQEQVDGQLRGFGRRALGPEYPYLWSAPAAAPPPESPHLRAARQLINVYYFESNWDNWVYMALIGLVFFGWVRYNFRHLPVLPPLPSAPFRYLQPWPVAATGVVVFSVAPALELHPPPVYLDVLQGLLLLSLTAVFWRTWPRPFFWLWVALLGLFGALGFSNGGNGASQGARWALLLLDGLAMGSGLLLLARLRQRVALPWFVVPVTYLFMGLNALAMACNVLGRLSLAKLFSTAGMFGLTQGIGLAVFVQLLTEAFHLQMVRSRAATSGGGGFDYAKIGAGLLRLLTVVVGALWLLVFISNLAAYGMLYSVLAHFLAVPRRLGSTSFTFGNILLFFLILYASARLQQYIGYFFGEIGDDASSRQRGSWLVGLRLLLVLVGLALATTASGLPLSKIAIVFGALSVGIGLGLQSIVNNLVSGIILIFERPFHVGDFIEVAGKSGRVQDIGIRSSKLASPTGSEIIVPNGDLLSSHVINWTRTNDHIRADLTLKLVPGPDLEADLQTARELIQAEIKTSPFTMSNLAPEILLNSVSDQLCELQVLFWIINIRQEQLTKSEILAGIYQRFKAHGLQLS